MIDAKTRLQIYNAYAEVKLAEDKMFALIVHMDEKDLIDNLRTARVKLQVAIDRINSILKEYE